MISATVDVNPCLKNNQPGEHLQGTAEHGMAVRTPGMVVPGGVGVPGWGGGTEVPYRWWGTGGTVPGPPWVPSLAPLPC